MTPAELDLYLNGFFIYAKPDGTRYLSTDYALQKYGVPLVGRTGKLNDDDLAGTVAEAMERHQQRLAA